MSLSLPKQPSEDIMKSIIRASQFLEHARSHAYSEGEFDSMIADFFGVKMEELTRIPKTPIERDIVHVFMGKVDSEQARTALKTADMLSDMILFHKRVRENGAAMMEAWDS